MVATVLNFRPRRLKEDKPNLDVGAVTVPAGSADLRVAQKVEDELTRKPAIGGQNIVERFTLSDKEFRTAARAPLEDVNPALLRHLRAKGTSLQTPELSPANTSGNKSPKSLEDVLKFFPKVPVLNN